VRACVCLKVLNVNVSADGYDDKIYFIYIIIVIYAVRTGFNKKLKEQDFIFFTIIYYFRQDIFVAK
jgi:hypothetical protein